jgi:hypothetical protein
VVVFRLDLESTFCICVDDLLAIVDSISLDPHDHGGHLEHNSWPFVELKSHQLGISMNVVTWDIGLWMNFFGLL